MCILLFFYFFNKEGMFLLVNILVICCEAGRTVAQPVTNDSAPECGIYSVYLQVIVKGYFSTANDAPYTT